MNHSSQQTRERFDRFTSMLASAGLRDALADVASITDYRFIAIFRFQDERANAVIYYDREQPEVLGVEEVAASDTYCRLARETREAFVTSDALNDARLTDHGARASVQSYCGVPIMTPEGAVLGTLCHYDLVPRDPNQVDLALMCEIASALEQGGHLPPYPIKEPAAS